MTNFFFIISDKKFLRVDLDILTRVTTSNDYIQLHSESQIYTVAMSSSEIKRLLPADKFMWTNENIAIQRSHAIAKR